MISYHPGLNDILPGQAVVKTGLKQILGDTSAGESVDEKFFVCIKQYVLVLPLLLILRLASDFCDHNKQRYHPRGHDDLQVSTPPSPLPTVNLI